MTEQELIFSLQKGVPAAFKQLVERYQHIVFNTVLGIVQDVQEAEDVAQEVFIQVHISVNGFRGESKLTTWLYRIAITKALDAQRKNQSKKRRADLRAWVGLGDKYITAVDFQHPGVTLDNKERAAMLFRAMKKLPGNQLTAFTLIKTEGLTYVEVAGIMEISVKAVEALMHRAKENLRKELTHYFKN